MSTASPTSPSTDTIADRALEMAERHHCILREMQEAAVAVSRVYADLAIASGLAAQATLAPEAWHPELERAQAIGAARHAAEAYHRVTRALRLTMAMERAILDSLRDQAAGIVAKPVTPIFTAAFAAPGEDIPPLKIDSTQTRGEVRAMARELNGLGDHFSFDSRDDEALVDIERGDRFGRIKFRETVVRICAAIGIEPQWDRWDGDGLRSPEPDPRGSEPLQIEPVPKAVYPPPNDPLKPSASRSSPPGSSPPPRCGSWVLEPASSRASG
jgi:hypothetical protein